MLKLHVNQSYRRNWLGTPVVYLTWCSKPRPKPIHYFWIICTSSKTHVLQRTRINSLTLGHSGPVIVVAHFVGFLSVK